MSGDEATFSIIIPVKPGGSIAALAAVRDLAYPAAAVEVLVAEGRRPSVQRNRAAGQASGSLLYFLDDDSLVRDDALTHIAEIMADQRLAAVGGPSLTPATDSPFQRSIGYALQSLLGGGGIRNRYRAVGARRIVDDSELILCNLCIRRDLFLANGGLDERLYPNEENELLDRLRAAGHTYMHDPHLAVTRSQRATPKAFIRQMFGYGVGRGEQTRISGRLSVASLIPPFFLLYLLSLPVVPIWWYSLPLALYLFLVAGTAVTAHLATDIDRIGVRLCAIVPAMHLLYGAGIIVGLIAPRFRAGAADAGEVAIRRVKHLGAPWDGPMPLRGEHA
jgi:hypothetical protein